MPMTMLIHKQPFNCQILPLIKKCLCLYIVPKWSSNKNIKIYTFYSHMCEEMGQLVPTKSSYSQARQLPCAQHVGTILANFPLSNLFCLCKTPTDNMQSKLYWLLYFKSATFNTTNMTQCTMEVTSVLAERGGGCTNLSARNRMMAYNFTHSSTCYI